MVKLIGFDTETVIKNKVHQFYSFQCYTEDYDLDINGLKQFSTDVNEFEKYLSARFKNCWFICFNLAFDGIVVSNMLKNKGYTVKAVYAGSRLIRMTIKRSGLKWIFADLRNVLPIGNLEKVGEMLKIPKLKKPSYLGQRAPETPKERYNFKKYAIRDAVICYKAAKMIREEFGIFKTTCAGLAIRVFKRDFMPKVVFKKYEDSLIEKLRFAYHGGRTECFIRGINFETLKQYDINSLYPFVMKNKIYPNVCKRFDFKSDVNLDYEGIAYVKVSSDAKFPPLCQKQLFKDGTEKLIFPNGVLKGYFTYPELRLMEEHNLGKILKVYEAYEFKETFNPFKSYIDHYYKLKEESTLTKSPKKNLYKIMLNSLYGKFGEHGSVKFLEFDGNDIVNQSFMMDRKAWYHSVVIASYITAYARLENWQYLNTLNEKKMFYTDTDCFVTSENMNQYCSSALGKLKLESEAKKGDACFIRAKFYMLNDTVKLKGFSVSDSPATLKQAIFKNDFSRQEHRILKFLDAQRLKQIPLTDCYITKKFSVESDGKRIYEKELTPQTLLFENSLSNPLTLSDVYD